MRTPFNVNNLALVAALAARGDSEFLHQSFENNKTGMQMLEKGIKQIGLDYIPSSGNFICMYCDPQKQNAATINQKLLKAGVIVRPLNNYNLPDYLRVTIGTDYENSRFLEELSKLF